MKFLDVQNFATLSSHLSGTRDGTRIVCQLESYSCKPAGVDKKIYKEYNFYNGHSPDQLLALSPPQTVAYPAETAQTTNRKTMYHLLSTLNASFPDYDFRDVDSRQFSREPELDIVMNSVNNTLRETSGDVFQPVQSELWSAIDTEIELQNCEIYSYIPLDDSDPFGEEGVVWSFNYFFVNPKLKRVVFFCCRGISLLSIEDGVSEASELAMPDRGMVFGEMEDLAVM